MEALTGKQKRLSRRVFKQLRRQPMEKQQILDAYIELRLSSSHSPERFPASPNDLANSRALAAESRTQILYVEAEAALEKLLSRASAYAASNKAAMVNGKSKSEGLAEPSSRDMAIETSFNSHSITFLPSFINHFIRSIISTVIHKVNKRR